MILFEFSKNFYRKLYFLLAICLLIGVIITFYFYNKNVFDITNIQIQLNQGAEKVFKKQITWHYDNSQLIGEISLHQDTLNLTYYLNKKKIGYQMVEKESHNTLQLPCLNILHVLPINTVRLMYQKLLSKGMDYKTSKNITVKKGLHVGYTYIEKQKKIFTSCDVYYD